MYAVWLVIVAHLLNGDIRIDVLGPAPYGDACWAMASQIQKPKDSLWVVASCEKTPVLST